MLFTNALLVGGAAYAYLKQRRQSPPLVEVVADGDDLLQVKTQNARHYSAMATLSVGLSLAGAITASPLVFLAIPINIYTNLPIFEEAIKTLGGKDEKLGSILLSLIIASTLAANHAFTASLIDWLSQRSRLTAAKLRQHGSETSHIVSESAQQWLSQALGKAPSNVWIVQDDTEMEIPFEALTIGDVALFRKGEFISVTGDVTRGEAEVFDWSLLGNPPKKRSVGDTVTPRMLVLDGILYVRVERIS